MIKSDVMIWWRRKKRISQYTKGMMGVKLPKNAKLKKNLNAPKIIEIKLKETENYRLS